VQYSATLICFFTIKLVKVVKTQAAPLNVLNTLMFKIQTTGGSATLICFWGEHQADATP